MPYVTTLSYKIENDAISAIENCNINVRVNVISVTQPMMSYSKILSAGSKMPLSANSNVSSFVDIILPNVLQIVSGATSMIALTTQGQVYGRGGNEDGELALGDATENWTKIEGFPNAIKQVALNHKHSLFLSYDGQVFSCGGNQFGQLVIQIVDSNIIRESEIHTIEAHCDQYWKTKRQQRLQQRYGGTRHLFCVATMSCMHLVTIQGDNLYGNTSIYTVLGFE